MSNQNLVSQDEDFNNAAIQSYNNRLWSKNIPITFSSAAWEKCNNHMAECLRGIISQVNQTYIECKVFPKDMQYAIPGVASEQNNDNSDAYLRINKITGTFGGAIHIKTQNED